MIEFQDVATGQRIWRGQVAGVTPRKGEVVTAQGRHWTVDRVRVVGAVTVIGLRAQTTTGG